MWVLRAAQRACDRLLVRCATYFVRQHPSAFRHRAPKILAAAAAALAFGCAPAEARALMLRGPVARFVVDTALARTCLARVTRTPAGTGGAQECEGRVAGGRATFQLAGDSTLVGLTRTWVSTPGAVAGALMARRDELARRFGPPQLCYGRLWVWSGPGWHAVLSLRAPDYAQADPLRGPPEVLLFARAESATVCGAVAA
jgi:hypothetical protein